MSELTIEQRFPEVFRQPVLKRYLPLALLAGLLVYLAYAVWFFALPSVFGAAKWDRAGNVLAQWVAYDVFAEFRLDAEPIEPKWSRFWPLGAKPDPDWLIRQPSGSLVVEIDGPGTATEFSHHRVTITHAGETVTVSRAETGATVDGPLP